jgi:hypothetical protein
MRSKYSAKAAKKVADQYDTDTKKLHPETIRIARLACLRAETGIRVTHATIPIDFEHRVLVELGKLGYQFMCIGQAGVDGSGRYEIQLPT